MKDFLSMTDEELAAFAKTFIDGAGELSATLNIAEEQIEAMNQTREDFKATMAEIRKTRAYLQSLTQKKANLRKTLKGGLRRLNKTTRASDGVTDAHLGKLGLKIYDRTQTATDAPQTIPHLLLTIKAGRRHIIEIFDFADSTARAKPKDSSGAEVWVYVGDDPTQMSEKNMRYLGTATRGTMTVAHDAEDAGKQAFYVARWVNRRGMRGTWSAMASATIAK